MAAPLARRGWLLCKATIEERDGPLEYFRVGFAAGKRAVQPPT